MTTDSLNFPLISVNITAFKMWKNILLVTLVSFLIECNAGQQVQMPEANALLDADPQVVRDLDLNDLVTTDVYSQVQELRHNVTDMWTYVLELKSAMSRHLLELKQNQQHLNEVIHDMEHHNEEGHSHSSESHSHSDGSDLQHSDSHHDSHSDSRHGSHSSDSHYRDSHSHGDEANSRGGNSHDHDHDHGHYQDSDAHSHDDDYSHSHDGHGSYDSHSHDGHGSYNSHSHSSSQEMGQHHGHYHGDPQKADDLQQSRQTAEKIEPLLSFSQSRQNINRDTIRPSSISPLIATDSPSTTAGHSHRFHHHYHHHSQPHRNYHGPNFTGRNRTVIVPKFSESSLYDFAICEVLPDKLVQTDHDVSGQISMWQKKTGGPLNFHIHLHGFKMSGGHQHHGPHQAVQMVEEAQIDETPAENHKHGFHIHELGDLSRSCASTGPHYSPKDVNHGGPTAFIRHNGDLGNIECDEHGETNVVFSDDIASLRSPYSILGRAIVIHSDADDYGLGDNVESLKTGNAGTRIACCVIQRVDKLHVRTYKDIRKAKQHRN